MIGDGKMFIKQEAKLSLG